jgi:acetyl-CoA C-acetyltransferase
VPSAGPLSRSRAKLPDAIGATTINKVCGSGVKATMLAHDIINAGSASVVVSGGMESAGNAQDLLTTARGGYRAGHDRIIDHMMMDALENAYETGRSMGDFGEATAEAYQFSRKDQDTAAIETLTRARKAARAARSKSRSRRFHWPRKRARALSQTMNNR